MNVIEITSLVSGIAAVGALICIFFQMFQRNKLAQYSALTQVHQELRSHEFLESLKKIHAATADELKEPISPELTDAIEQVTGIYDLIGVRIKEHVLPKAATLRTEWNVLGALWPRVEDFVKSRREGRGRYKEDFEWIVNQAEIFRVKKLQIYNATHTNMGEHKQFIPNIVTNSKIAYTGNHLHFYKSQQGWEFVRRAKASKGVTIVAITDDEYLLFVEQYRIPVGKNVIELPAGLVGDLPSHNRENFEQAVKRELQEETGFCCSTISPLCNGPILPGITDEFNIFCLAKDMGKIISENNANSSKIIKINSQFGNIEEGEQITVWAIHLSSVKEWLKIQEHENKSIDPRIYVGLYFLTNQELNM